MASTQNLNLAKPAGTDKALVSVLNSNSDKIDAWAGTTNQALSNLDTPTVTADILASALQTTKAKLFRGSGSSYTGTLPDNSFKWGTFSVEPYDNGRTVFALSDGHAAINYYNGTAWTGWQQLELKSNIRSADITGTTTANGNLQLPIAYWEGIPLVVKLKRTSDNGNLYTIIGRWGTDDSQGNWGCKCYGETEASGLQKLVAVTGVLYYYKF